MKEKLIAVKVVLPGISEARKVLAPQQWFGNLLKAHVVKCEVKCDVWEYD